jgi:hypothetical protein
MRITTLLAFLFSTTALAAPPVPTNPHSLELQQITNHGAIIQLPATSGIFALTGGGGGITLLNGLSPTTQTFATGTSGVDFGISSVGSVHTFNLPTAGPVNTGKLSSADWSTFNNKQSAGSYLTALTGDVTASGPGSAAATIATNAVTNAKAAQMAAHTFKGNNTGSTANALDLTATQLTAELNLFTSGLQGLVPASGGGTTNFLRADGTFAAPSSSGASAALDNLTGFTAGQVVFPFSSSTLVGDSTFFWDNINKRFGIGTGSPTAKLHILGTDSGTVQALIRAASGQTANILEAQNASGTATFKISPAGVVVLSAGNDIRGDGVGSSHLRFDRFGTNVVSVSNGADDTAHLESGILLRPADGPSTSIDWIGSILRKDGGHANRASLNWNTGALLDGWTNVDGMLNDAYVEFKRGATLSTADAGYLLVAASSGGDLQFKDESAVTNTILTDRKVTLKGTTSGTVTISPPASFTSYSLTLPLDDGTSGQFLQTDGSGVLSWAAASGFANTALSNLTGFTTGQIVVPSSSSVLTSYPELFWDSAQKSLGIGGGSISNDLDIFRGSSASARVHGGGSSGSGSYFTQNDTDVGAKMISHGSVASGTVLGFLVANHAFFTDLVSANSTGLTVGTRNAQPLTLGTNNAEWVRILSTGEVGIGTTTPAAPLTVVTTGSNPVQFRGADASTAVGDGVSLVLQNSDTTNNNYAQIFFGDVSGAAGSVGVQITDHTNDYGDLVFLTRSAAGYTEKARILSTGAFQLKGATSGFTALKAAAVAGSTTYELPSADGSSGQVLQTNGSAVLSWASSSGGISTLNTLTAATQFFAAGTGGTDFNISSVTDTHTFNIPSASATARGLVTTGAQTIAGDKTLTGNLSVGGYVNLVEISTPAAPSSGNLRIYSKTDDLLYRRGNATGEVQMADHSSGDDFVPKVTGSVASPTLISASATISFSGTHWKNIMFIAGDSGPVTLGSPQIAAGNAVGQELTIYTEDTTNTVTLVDGTGLDANGTFVGSSGRVWDATWTGAVWHENYRR